MSTFGGLNIAHSGLTAARAALDVTGQNIANAGTQGYTRQRLTLTPSSAGRVGLFTPPIPVPGQGVTVSGTVRMGDMFVDTRVREAHGVSGYSGTRASALSELEATFNEPGKHGISAQLQNFWNSWQDLSNHPGEKAQGAVVLQNAEVLTNQIAAGYHAVDRQWSTLRTKTDSLAAEINGAADQVAALNKTIRSGLAAGSSVNELFDQRDQLLNTITAIAGGSVRSKTDGTVDVTIGGNLLVTGTEAKHVQVTGSLTMLGVDAAPPRLEWVDRPGNALGLDSGELAGALSLLAPAGSTLGNGGALADTAASYNTVASALSDQVNAIHNASVTTDGQTGLDFFSLTAGVPAALGLTVVPTDVTGIAAGTPGAGAKDGTAADAISQLGNSAISPDSLWSSTVSGVGAMTKSELQQSSLADAALTNASNAQLAGASVDLDEENIALITQQAAYQASARVISAIDEMLDTLINRTGTVGR